MTIDPRQLDIRDPYTPQVPNSFLNVDELLLSVQCFNMSIVQRKVHHRPFRVGLELATSHSGLAESMQRKYRAG